MKGRYAVFVVDLAGNTSDVLYTDDAVTALCRYYEELELKEHGHVGIADYESDGRHCVSRLEEDESTACTRFGAGPDRCTKSYGHLGICVDVQGNTTLTLAASILRGVER